MPNGTGKSGTGSKNKENEPMNKAGFMIIISTAILILIIYTAAIIGSLETRHEERIKNE